MGKGNHTDRGVAGGRISIKSGGIPAESSVLSRQGGSEQSARQIDSERGDKAMLARFEAVALPHFDAIYRLARALAASDSEADDLVQETFVRAFQGFGGFELREYGARPWLYRILHNTFCTFKVKQRREPSSSDLMDVEPYGPVADGASGWDGETKSVNWEHFDEEIKSAVDQLPTDYRTALLLWSIEGYSYKEIADICDCALGTVMSRLYRARRLMGKHLRDYARDRKWPTDRFES